MTAALASLADWEREVLHLVTCRWHAPWLGPPLELVQRWGIGIAFVVAAAGLLALRDPRRAARALFAAGVGAGLALALGTATWAVVVRQRPGNVYERVLRTPEEWRTCAEHPEAFVLRSHGPKHPSFPSHHALTAAAVATALALAWRPIGVAAWLLALVVGWGRLYLGKHWPTDVLAGYVLGAALGWAAWSVAPPVFRALRLRRLLPPEPPSDPAAAAGPSDGGPRRPGGGGGRG